MATVELTRIAVQDLNRLIVTHSLPADTRQRVRAALLPLIDFPRLGPELSNRWEGMRFLLGPWRWMIMVHSYDEASDRVVVVTIQDARSTCAGIMQ